VSEVLELAPVGDWLVAMLHSVLGFEVGFAEAPLNANGSPKSLPYLIVSPVSGPPYSEEPIGSPDGCGWTLWQIDAVGQQQRQVGVLADRVKLALLSRNADGTFVNEPATSGFDVNGRMAGDGWTATSEGDWPNQVWTAYDRFGLYVTKRSTP
jgi:hypothetical protein